eukprot:7721118-Ditylum_brightwellii.AAC.1
MESLRTESMSLPSLLRFLLRYRQYYGGKIQEETKIYYSDNLTVVRSMNWAEKKPNTTPGEFLVADTDVQQQIEATLHKMGLDLKSLHMKGHQDNKGHKHLTWGKN